MFTIATTPRTGFLFFDLALLTQKAVIESTLEGARALTRGAGRGVATTQGEAVQGERVVPLAEEVLHVEAREVPGKTTRVRRYVVETPVERQVSLQDKRVVVERRRPVLTTASGDVLTETTIEATETTETPVVWKGVRVREEVVLRLETKERVETVRETVRRDEVDIQEPLAARPQLSGALIIPAEVKIDTNKGNAAKGNNKV